MNSPVLHCLATYTDLPLLSRGHGLEIHKTNKMSVSLGDSSVALKVFDCSPPSFKTLFCPPQFLKKIILGII